LASKSANSSERNAFIEKHVPIAKSLAAKYGVPASVLLAMACVESGYGFTRTAIYAHNYFGIKNQNGRLEEVYQLLGQPNEDGQPYDFAVEVVEDDPNRIIFDESKRRTNRYRVFKNPDAAFEYLAGTLFQNTRYRPAVMAYASNRRSSMTKLEAAAEFARDIAARGYHHLGGDYYRDNVILPILKRHKLANIDL
jgi:flagellum-specific peptidoglycan hydrolase FlgJ